MNRFCYWWDAAPMFQVTETSLSHSRTTYKRSVKYHIVAVIIVMLVMGIFSTPDALARQYKSRVFQDSNQELSSSELQNIAQLEQAFAGFEDDYQIATSGQFLARQMVAEQQFEKAADYYNKALKSAELSGDIPQPMLRQLRLELASVLLKLQRYQEVISLVDKTTEQTDERFMLARAHLGLQQFHLVVTALQPLQQSLEQLNLPQLQQLTGLLYQADALQLTATVLKEVLRRTPEDVNTARQLTGLYIRLQEYQQALDLWSLQYAQGLLAHDEAPETAAQDMLLLADLYQRQQAPEKAARLLQQSIKDAVVPASWQNQYRLFEFWYQAKELELAREALWQSIQLSQGSQEHLQHSLILAELLQQVQSWQALEELILFSCDSVLPDRFVGRINLFYGIALHKLGNNSDARRAFINASLISGVKPQAREWLAFIQAEPATVEESRELWGPCLPEDPEIELPKALKDRTPKALRDKTAKALRNNTSEDLATEPANDLIKDQQSSAVIEAIPVTELNAVSLFSTRLTTTPADMQRDLKTKVFTLLKNLMRSGGKVDGKMHLWFSFEDSSAAQDNAKAQQLKMSVGFPYSGLPRTKAGFKILKLPKRQALIKHFQGPATELHNQWQQLVTQAITQGLTPNGQAVMVFLSDTSGTDVLDVELQLLL